MISLEIKLTEGYKLSKKLLKFARQKFYYKQRLWTAPDVKELRK